MLLRVGVVAFGLSVFPATALPQAVVPDPQSFPSIEIPTTAAQLPSAKPKAQVKRSAPAGATSQAAPSAQGGTQTRTPGQASPVPPVEIVVLMLRSSLLALDQANKTNDYAVLRALSSPAFQVRSPEELSKVFASFREKKIDLSPALVTKPQLKANPVVLPNGILHLAAIFPTKPLSIDCVVEMAPVAGFWRLSGLTVDLVPAEPLVAQSQMPQLGQAATGQSPRPKR